MKSEHFLNVKRKSREKTIIMFRKEKKIMNNRKKRKAGKNDCPKVKGNETDVYRVWEGRWSELSWEKGYAGNRTTSQKSKNIAPDILVYM